MLRTLANQKYYEIPSVEIDLWKHKKPVNVRNSKGGNRFCRNTIKPGNVMKFQCLKETLVENTN